MNLTQQRQGVLGLFLPNGRYDMNAMNMPGFTAAASLYRTSGHYRSAARTGGYGKPGVLAQLTLSCPTKGCGPCLEDSTSSKGGRKCCCHPPCPDSADPVEVECVFPPPSPPPTPPTNCGTHFCPPFSPCCDGRTCCPAGAHCCNDGHGCCRNDQSCRSFLGRRFCWPPRL